jgi:hypothetical protein
VLFEATTLFRKGSSYTLSLIKQSQTVRAGLWHAAAMVVLTVKVRVCYTCCSLRAAVYTMHAWSVSIHYSVYSRSILTTQLRTAQSSRREVMKERIDVS